MVNRDTKEVSYQEVVCNSDECNKPDTTLEGLQGLKPIMIETNPKVRIRLELPII